MSATLFRLILISIHILNIAGFLIWENEAILWLILVVTIIGSQLKPRITLLNKVHTILSVTITFLIGIILYGIYIGDWISDPYAEIGFTTMMFIVFLFEPETKKTLFTRHPTESSKTTKD